MRIEQQSKLSEIIATTLTSRDNTGPAGVVAVAPILPPGSFYCIPDFFTPFFLHMNSNGSIPSATLAHKEECLEQNANEADREIDDLQNPRAPCFRKTTRTPHACTKHIKRTERKSTVAWY